MFWKKLIYNIDAQNYLEGFLVIAVSTVLIIRFYLHLTNYPQIGGEGLHIAHMLWGGFFMLSALIMLLSFLNPSVYKVAVILGGIGFGTFIDELGKFITHDNNYFFEPTISLIYIIFILLFLIFRFLDRRRILTQKERVDNAFELLRRAHLTRSATLKEKALAILGDGSFDKTATLLYELAEQIRPVEAKTGVFGKIVVGLENFSKKLLHAKLFNRIIITFFVIFTLFNLYSIADVVMLYLRVPDFTFSFIDIGELVSSFASAVFVVIGIFRLKSTRFSAYHAFRVSILISIFLTQFFNFYKSQLSAVFILFFDLLVLVILQYIISQKHPAAIEP
ncbi:MAG TPA: hypothetical protein VLF68_03540 [Candidatus Saccharimonadales bacterium]|nr:hypothetical protein [Candidatus Saccharimonadales bacterium]